MVQLKDVLHLYLGCDVFYKHKEHKGLINIYQGIERWVLQSVHLIDMDSTVSVNLEADHSIIMVDDIKKIKPMLRQLSSMTAKECRQYNKLRETLYTMAEAVNQCMQEAACINYLLKERFDLFNLIESGQALDATKIPIPSLP